MVDFEWEEDLEPKESLINDADRSGLATGIHLIEQLFLQIRIPVFQASLALSSRLHVGLLAATRARDRYMLDANDGLPASNLMGLGTALPCGPQLEGFGSHY